jgi:predicted DNA-binding ribbon-helix-helix protein
VWHRRHAGARRDLALGRWREQPAQLKGSVACYVASRRSQGTLIKRTISLADRRTSVALEAEFWAALKHIAANHQETLTALVAEADARRPEGRPLASALRVLALQAFLPPTGSAHARHRYR